MTRGFLSEGGGARRARLTDIACQVRRETERAWLIFDGSVEVWLPKSQVENNGDGTFTLPEWLATEKGLA
jgi:hypothetical protein